MIYRAILAVYWLLWGSLALAQSTQPAPGTQPATDVSGILYQLKPIGDPQTQPYCLVLDRQSMAQIVTLLREKYGILLSFEDLDYDSQNPQDVVSIQEAMAELQKQPQDGGGQKLSMQDELTVALAQELSKRPDGQKLVFDSRSPRFGGTVTGGSVEELLTLLTSDTIYAWGQSGPVLVIYPRNKSILRYKVTLRVKEGSLVEAMRQIVNQRPPSLKGLTLVLEAGPAAARTFHKIMVQIPYFQGSAIEVLCKTAEEAGHGVVWQVTGFKGARCISLLQVQPVPAPATGPATQPLGP